MDIDSEKPAAKPAAKEIVARQMSSQETSSNPNSPPTKGPSNLVDPLDRPDEDMSDLTNSMSALRFVPQSVRFGRGRGKVGFSKR
jgi:hypothetical protein